MNNKHEGILSFGCGCNKGGAAKAVATTNRSTIYQVVLGGAVTGEFASLPEARQQAITNGGRVKVTTKANS